MMILRRALIALLLAAAAPLVSPTPALAQDAEQVQLARDMMVAMKAADNFDAVIPTVMNALKPAITAGNPKLQKDWDEIAPTLIREFSAMKSGMIEEIAAIYAKAFTKEELRSFVGFYKSPAGEKLARLTPVLAQQTMVAGQRLGQQVAAKVVERMKEELRKRGNTI